MKVLMISGDRAVTRQGSAVRARMALYGRACTQLHIVVPSEGQGETIADNVFVHPTGNSSALKRFSGIVQTGRIIGDVDLITAQDPFEYGMAALTLGTHLEVPVELQVHTDIGSPYFKKDIKNKVRMTGVAARLRKATNVRVVSQRVARAVEHLGVPRERTAVLPMFIDAQRFLGVTRAPALKEKIVLMSGRLEKEKDYPTALSAFARVHAHIPEARLHIAGDGGLRDALTALVKKHGLEDAVTFLGFVEDVAPHFASAHVFLHTARYEGFGAAIAEAALAGVPVVSSDVGIAGTLLQDGEHAWVVPVGDTNRITGALLEAVTRPKESHERALLASAWMHKHLLAPDAYVAALQSVWEKTVQNK